VVNILEFAWGTEENDEKSYP